MRSIECTYSRTDKLFHTTERKRKATLTLHYHILYMHVVQFVKRRLKMKEAYKRPTDTCTECRYCTVGVLGLPFSSASVCKQSLCTATSNQLRVTPADRCLPGVLGPRVHPGGHDASYVLTVVSCVHYKHF